MQKPGVPREPVGPPLYWPWLMGKFQENRREKEGQDCSGGQAIWVRGGNGGG